MTPENDPTDLSSRQQQVKPVNLLKILGVIFLCLTTLLSGLRPRTGPNPHSPSPTPTKPMVIPNNDNVEALNTAKAALGEFEFGFAPLLEEDATRVVIEPKPEGEVARLAYPLQPANPAEWPAMDSFVLAYAVQQSLLQSPRGAGGRSRPV